MLVGCDGINVGTSPRLEHLYYQKLSNPHTIYRQRNEKPIPLHIWTRRVLSKTPKVHHEIKTSLEKRSYRLRSGAILTASPILRISFYCRQGEHRLMPELQKSSHQAHSRHNASILSPSSKTCQCA